MSKEEVFQTYYMQIRAVKITHANFPKLKKLFLTDIFLYSHVKEEDLIGDWLTAGPSGFQVLPGITNLILAYPVPK